MLHPHLATRVATPLIRGRALRFALAMLVTALAVWWGPLGGTTRAAALSLALLALALLAALFAKWVDRRSTAGLRTRPRRSAPSAFPFLPSGAKPLPAGQHPAPRPRPARTLALAAPGRAGVALSTPGRMVAPTTARTPERDPARYAR